MSYEMLWRYLPTHTRSGEFSLTKDHEEMVPSRVLCLVDIHNSLLINAKNASVAHNSDELRAVATLMDALNSTASDGEISLEGPFYIKSEAGGDLGRIVLMGGEWQYQPAK